MSDESQLWIHRSRDRIYAERLAFDIALAVENGHADIIRTAIGKVFDLTAVEEATKRQSLALARNQEAIDRQRVQLDEIEQRLNRAAQFAAKLNGVHS